MSRTIQIRNVPDHVHLAVRSRARCAGVSLSDYLLGEIVRVAERPPVVEVLTRATGRGAGPGPDAIVRAVRSGRDRSE
ncbi:MAG: hypothetical protein ABR564_06550 [Candidatus Dormibacteria bacterium]